MSHLLLLRISPHTFAFIPIPSMCLSSRNRSNSKVFRYILPCISPVCEGMHYHKTGVPWQMNKTFIITPESSIVLYKSLHLRHQDFTLDTLICNPKIIQICFIFILRCQASVNQIPIFIVPFFQSTIVKHL